MKLNKGEWSELYVFLKLLFDMNIKIVDSQLCYTSFSYNIKSILFDNKEYKEKHNEFYLVSNLLHEILESKGSSFEISNWNNIKEIFHIENSKNGKKYDKADIQIKLQHINNAINRYLGFSIKSYLGRPPTLLNSSQATTLKYKILNFKGDMFDINGIKTKSKIKDRINKIIDCSSGLKLHEFKSKIFYSNLQKSDSAIPEIIAELLLEYYSNYKFSNISDVIQSKYIDSKIDIDHIIYKVSKFLKDSALSFFPNKQWDGYEQAEGYIVVNKQGDLYTFDVFNERDISEYIFKNTKFDTPSSSRYNFGLIYAENGEYFIDLNLQIRFK